MITSPDNPKLKLARRLRERSTRRREGLFISEGEDLLEAGLAAGWSPVEILARAGTRWATSGTEAVSEVPHRTGAGSLEVSAVEAPLLDYTSTLGSGTRVIALWQIPEVEVESGLCVFLDGVADPGNVGTIIRSAAALAGAQVLVGAGTADPWGPKAVRASMGAVFARPPGSVDPERAPTPRVGIDAHSGGDLDQTLAAIRPRSLCLGAEREGLSSEVAVGCEATVTIPLQAGAESLNVAAAAAICLHRLSSLAGDSGAGSEE